MVLEGFGGTVGPWLISVSGLFAFWVVGCKRWFRSSSALEIRVEQSVILEYFLFLLFLASLFSVSGEVGVG